jgi:hypothetical protein
MYYFKIPPCEITVFLYVVLPSAQVFSVALKLQILRFWTLSIVLSVSKTSRVYISKHNVSETDSISVFR